MSTTVAPLPEAALADLTARVRGEVIRRGMEGYEVARRVYNGTVDCCPAVIVRAVDAADVATGVDFAREQRLVLSVRGGGHSVAGFGANDGGVVLDLSRLREVRIDPNRRIARIEGGATWGDLDRAGQRFGLSTPGGIISSTGVAGLTLGGGFGYLSRQHGLCCDNLLAAELVTADGRLVRASAEEHADLFWAIRGGGGNFGVVTALELRLHPVGTVLGGPVFYAIEQCEEVLRFYRQFIASAPEALSAFFAFHIASPEPCVPERLHHVPVCAIVACWNGPLDEGERLLKPLRAFGPPVLDLTGPMPYPVLNSFFDGLLPAGLFHYWKADFDRDLTDEAIDIHVQHGPNVPNLFSLMHLYPLDGAVSRVAPEATAFSHRDVGFAHVVAGIDSEAARMPNRIAWVRDYWAALHRHSAGGAYVNFLMNEGDDRIRATYRGNYARLVEAKRAWDPDNLFRMNQNIRP